MTAWQPEASRATHFVLILFINVAALHSKLLTPLKSGRAAIFSDEKPALGLDAQGLFVELLQSPVTISAAAVNKKLIHSLSSSPISNGHIDVHRKQPTKGFRVCEDIMKKVLLGSAMAIAMTSHAFAAGWIAQHIIKPIAGEHAAREADKIHAQLGKPLNKVPALAAGVAADAVVPGSGAAVAATVEAARNQ